MLKTSEKKTEKNYYFILFRNFFKKIEKLGKLILKKIRNEETHKRR